MNMKHPIEIINELKSTSSSNAKMDLIIKYDNLLMRKIYLYALDPYLLYGIKTLPKYVFGKTKIDVEYNLDDMFALLDKMSLGELTGNKALEACLNFMEKAHDNDVAIFQKNY